MKENKFSFFRPPLWSYDDRETGERVFGNTIPEPTSVSLRSIFQYIQGDVLKEKTENLRRLVREDISSYKYEKNFLPFVTFEGVFDYRSADREKLQRKGKRGLLSPSNYLILDIDHVSLLGRDLLELETSLARDKELGIRLIFLSPSGDGLKFVIESLRGFTDDDSYRKEYFSVLGYIHEKHSVPYWIKSGGKKIQILDQTTEIARACLLCHDKDVIFMEEGTILYSPGFNSETHHYEEEEVRKTAELEEGKTPKPKTERPKTPISGDWGSFVEYKLLPAIFDRIDQIFPEYGFTWRGNKWTSSLKLDLSPATDKTRRDKTIVYGEGSKYFGTIHEQGGESYRYIELYEERNGLSFPEARKELSRICGLEEEELELRRKTAEDRNKDRKDTNTMIDKETPTGGEKVPETAKYSRYFELPKSGDLWDELSRDPEGFKTSFSFGVGEEREVLTIPREGVTYICGLSSHFKSTLLRNLALQMTEDDSQGEGDILFFSLEESPRKTKLRLLCAYSDTFFQKVRNYAKTKDLYYIAPAPEYQEQFREKADKFESFLTSGKLRLFHSPENVSDIIELLEEYRKERPIKAVFIDFIQRLKAGNTPSRTDEMRIIAESLQNFSKRQIGERKLPGDPIPVIVAAQLNRLTPSPTRMGANNIAESADLTRYAETIICLWGSHKKEDVTDEKFIGSKEETKLQALGFTLGTPGTIYAKITKNKEGESGLEGILRVNGASGYISQKNESQTKTIWGK